MMLLLLPLLLPTSPACCSLARSLLLLPSLGFPAASASYLLHHTVYGIFILHFKLQQQYSNSTAAAQQAIIR
jgi:hypothetical protein